MEKKELIDLIKELKQQLDENRETDLDNYVGTLSKRAEKMINHFESSYGDIVVIKKSTSNVNYYKDDDSCEY